MHKKIHPASLFAVVLLALPPHALRAQEPSPDATAARIKAIMEAAAAGGKDAGANIKPVPTDRPKTAPGVIRPPQMPASQPPPPPPSHLPDFIQVNGIYIFDGGEDDLVKVLELDGVHGWVRVQTKAGESWVNISNVTTITPISKDAAAKTEMKAKADFIRDGAAAISAAIDDLAAKQNLSMDAPIKWDDLRKLLKSNTALYNSNGKDVSGRPYIIGPKVQDYVKVSPETIKEFTPVIDEPGAYWGKYKP